VTVVRKNRWIPRKSPERDVYPIGKREEKQPILHDKLRDWLLDPANRQRLEDHLDWYLRTDNEYEGRQFEWFSSKEEGQRFTSYHVLAAESLSVKVPSTAVRWLLEPDKGRNDLLDKVHRSLVPGANALWTCDVELLRGTRQALESSGALYRLYYNLRTLGTNDLTRGGIGQVTTSKLLAAMFPAVVPIRDSMVAALLGLTSSDDWWLLARGLFEHAGKSLAVHLDGLTIPPDASPVMTLRRLDIILWMEANARQF
jgi:hypothetical protein